MPSGKVWGFRPENDTEADMKEWRNEHELNDTEALRRLVRQGLEFEAQSDELAKIREAREEADARARAAVNEMREVRHEWERERRIIQGIALLGALSLAAASYSSAPLVEAAGTLLALVAIGTIGIVAGGWVDWFAGRREGLDGRTEPPGEDDGPI